MSWTLQTDHPIAYESPDHLHPYGTMQDNSRNWDFCRKLFALRGEQISLLDIGCAGGGLVKDMIDHGNLAVGLEGSDYSKRHKRAEWATIPDSLFTCDVTKPFTLRKDGDPHPFAFDVVTAWEFFEHIHRDDLAAVCDNVRRHLVPSGLLICSIANFPSPHEGVDLHLTQEDAPWWLETFGRLGFVRRSDFEAHFGNDWVRHGSFNFVLENSGRPAAKPRALSALGKLRARLESLRR